MQNNESDLLTYVQVRQRKTLLAWEEMARLEFALSKMPLSHSMKLTDIPKE